MDFDKKFNVPEDYTNFLLYLKQNESEFNFTINNKIYFDDSDFPLKLVLDSFFSWKITLDEMHFYEGYFNNALNYILTNLEEGNFLIISESCVHYDEIISYSSWIGEIIYNEGVLMINRTN